VQGCQRRVAWYPQDHSVATLGILRIISALFGNLSQRSDDALRRFATVLSHGEKRLPFASNFCVGVAMIYPATLSVVLPVSRSVAYRRPYSLDSTSVAMHRVRLPFSHRMTSRCLPMLYFESCVDAETTGAVRRLKQACRNYNKENSVRISKNTKRVATVKINWLIVFRKIVTVYSENNSRSVK
jgi:hypothetical protein